ncbi:hypothetical protein D3C73_919700 [compost metagenome]
MAHVGQESTLGFAGAPRLGHRFGQLPQQRGKIQGNRGQAKPQADGQARVLLPVRSGQCGTAEADHRHRHGHIQVVVAEAHAVAHRHPHHHDVDPRQRLTHLDHAGGDQPVVGQHAQYAPGIGALRSPQQPAEQQQRQAQAGQHDRQHSDILGVRQFMPCRRQQHVRQNQADQDDADDLLPVLTVLPLGQAQPQSRQQAFHAPSPGRAEAMECSAQICSSCSRPRSNASTQRGSNRRPRWAYR